MYASLSQPLSPRQMAILRFVYAYSQQHGRPPSIRDIGQGVNISSTSVVNYNLTRLAQFGYLEKPRGTTRSIVLREAGYRMIGKHTLHDLQAEIARLVIENRQLREQYEQLHQDFTKLSAVNSFPT